MSASRVLIDLWVHQSFPPDGNGGDRVLIFTCCLEEASKQTVLYWVILSLFFSKCFVR